MEDVIVGPREILDAWDEDLLVYLDDEDYITVPAAERMRRYALHLLSRDIDIAGLDAEWPAWFPLVDAFVAGHGLDDIAELYEEAELGGASGTDPLTPGGFRFVEELVPWLEMYLDQRRTGMDF